MTSQLTLAFRQALLICYASPVIMFLLAGSLVYLAFSFFGRARKSLY